MLPALERCEGVIDLIEDEQYFVIYAARQSGKTTLLLELEKEINAKGHYYALYCSLENVQGIQEEERGIPEIVGSLEHSIKFDPNLGKVSFPRPDHHTTNSTLLTEYLNHLCMNLDKPFVLLFDEVDCLSGPVVISFLRQLRKGYILRNKVPFVHSLALVGMRNIRDYRGETRKSSETLGSSSPFNIVKEARQIKHFSEDEIASLYRQHTQMTEQIFPPEVIQEVFEKTQGQPWLVNAIAYEIVAKLLKSDNSASIQAEHVERAIQQIVLRRDTHIDSLLERLKEARVQKIIEPLILGTAIGFEDMDDDFKYVLDLGLIRKKKEKLEPANPIYGEVMLRVLSYQAKMKMGSQEYPPDYPTYLKANRLDMKKILTDFQNFWREHSEIWTDMFQYKEAAPHLILNAFLSKVVNSGGVLNREMATGNLRLDLHIAFQDERYPIELKIRYGNKTYEDGQHQLSKYMDRLGCREGWLIVFDRRPTLSWKDKIFWKTDDYEGKTIHTLGC